MNREQISREIQRPLCALYEKHKPAPFHPTNIQYLEKEYNAIMSLIDIHVETESAKAFIEGGKAGARHALINWFRSLFGKAPLK